MGKKRRPVSFFILLLEPGLLRRVCGVGKKKTHAEEKDYPN